MHAGYAYTHVHTIKRERVRERKERRKEEGMEGGRERGRDSVEWQEREHWC